MVLVSSSCHNKMPWAGWFINNRNEFLTILEAAKCKIKSPAISMSGEDMPPRRWPSFPLSSHGERGKGALGVLFYKDVNHMQKINT